MDYQQRLQALDLQRLQNRRIEIQRGRARSMELREQQRVFNMHTQIADAEIDIPAVAIPDYEQPVPSNTPQEHEDMVATPRTPVR